MRRPRLFLDMLALAVSSCTYASDDASDNAVIGYCESALVGVNLATADGRATIAGVTVEGCASRPINRSEFQQPVSHTYVTLPGQGEFLITVEASDGRTFMATATRSTLRVEPMKCRVDDHRIYEFDHVDSIYPAHIVVEFADHDAGTSDAAPSVQDAGAPPDAQACRGQSASDSSANGLR